MTVLSSEPLWAITSYYNPCQSVRRRLNYHRFRQSLSLPLVTIECSLDGAYELSGQDADILRQVSSSALLWHKESLLNLALDAVPAEVPYVAWIDCDVLFPEPDPVAWRDQLVSWLGRHSLVQLFGSLKDLDAGESLQKVLPPLEKIPTVGRSIASIIAGNLISRHSFAPQTSAESRSNVMGIAWAARADLMRAHRFYDSMIVGSGDRALACAALGRFDEVVSALRLSDVRAEHYRAWAGPFHRAVAGDVASLPGAAVHLWHGDIAERQYINRHATLSEIGFDPLLDVFRAPNGLWQWRRARPDLERFFRDYFQNRKEDGQVCGLKR